MYNWNIMNYYEISERANSRFINSQLYDIKNTGKLVVHNSKITVVSIFSY